MSSCCRLFEWCLSVPCTRTDLSNRATDARLRPHSLVYVNLDCFINPVLYLSQRHNWKASNQNWCLQAVAAANVAAKGMADLQHTVADAVDADGTEEDALNEENKQTESAVPEEISEEEFRRRAALDKLEGASQDSFLGQVSSRKSLLRELWVWVEMLTCFMISLCSISDVRLTNCCLHCFLVVIKFFIPLVLTDTGFESAG